MNRVKRIKKRSLLSSEGVKSSLHKPANPSSKRWARHSGKSSGQSSDRTSDDCSSIGKRVKQTKSPCDSLCSLTESYSESSSLEYFERKRAALQPKKQSSEPSSELSEPAEPLKSSEPSKPSKPLKSGETTFKLLLLKHLPGKTLNKLRAHRPDEKTTKSEMLFARNRLNYQKFGRPPKRNLLKTIRNKLRSFGARVEDASIDSMLVHMNSPTREVLLDHSSDRLSDWPGERPNDRQNCWPSVKLSSIRNENEVNKRPVDQADQLDPERKPKKLFSEFFDRLSSSTARLVRSLTCTKEDELVRMKVAKKKVNRVVKNLRHNLTNIITLKKKRD